MTLELRHICIHRAVEIGLRRRLALRPPGLAEGVRAVQGRGQPREPNCRARALENMGKVMAQYLELLLEIGFVQPHLAMGEKKGKPTEEMGRQREEGRVAQAVEGAKQHGCQNQHQHGSDVQDADQRLNGGDCAETVDSNGGCSDGFGGPRDGRQAHVKKQGLGAGLSQNGTSVHRALMKSHLVGGDHYNQNARSDRVVRAVLCAGLYPNVVRVSAPQDGGDGAWGGSGGGAGRGPRIESPQGLPLSLHPSSVNANVSSFESRWLVYYEKVRAEYSRLLSL
eukprot:5779444-Pleurochrysis_carterae.AAC.1